MMTTAGKNPIHDSEINGVNGFTGMNAVMNINANASAPPKTFRYREAM